METILEERIAELERRKAEDAPEWREGYDEQIDTHIALRDSPLRIEAGKVVSEVEPRQAAEEHQRLYAFAIRAYDYIHPESVPDGAKVLVRMEGEEMVVRFQGDERLDFSIWVDMDPISGEPLRATSW